MRLVQKTTLFAAVAIVSVSMLMDTAPAVEVSDAVPLLPTPQDAGASNAQSPDRTQVDPASRDCFIIGSQSFSIPFTVDASGSQPMEVHLFVARDQQKARGEQKTWELLDRKRPDVAVKQFQFTAPEDGEYWFATRTIDALGRPHPATEMQPQLKVYVDTTKPNVRLHVDADATGRVDATFAIQDATPVKNMQLRYATDSASQWRDVDLRQLAHDGKVQFTPAEAWKQLSLQVVATDTPGNRSVVTQSLRRPRLADSRPSRFAAAAGNDAVDVKPVPHRQSHMSDQVNALAVSDPVIRLDRRKPRPPSDLVTAHGYAPRTASGNASTLYGFRGSADPSQPPWAVTPTQPGWFPTRQNVNTGRQNVNTGRQNLNAGRQNVNAVGQHVKTTRQNLNPSLQNLHAVRQNTSDAGGSVDAATPASNLPLPFAPPSVRGTVAPQNTVAMQSESLPTTSAPSGGGSESSGGLGLNSPQQTAGNAATTGGPPSPQPAARPRTPAEAMRPLSEESAVPESDTAKPPAPSSGAEIIATPEPQPDPSPQGYRSMRPQAGGMLSGRAPIRFSDSERFSLEYELEAVGSRGVDAIELYGSVDGRTWEMWGQDPDRRSPFDIETKEQGVFGFRIVVVGQNGLASPRPMANESPDIVVVVDKTAPTVRITGAQYGEGDRIGSLVIGYDCADANLQKRPIALSFSDSLEGPWTTIAAGLRNDGQYVWPADPQLPRQLYLRIDATDQAGNIGTHILDQPIDAQGLAPRARIRGFQPLSGDLPVAPGQQTAGRPAAKFK